MIVIIIIMPEYLYRNALINSIIYIFVISIGFTDITFDCHDEAVLLALPYNLRTPAMPSTNGGLIAN